MNETRRKPTTGRQSPSLFDKWHGIFYMPSRIPRPLISQSRITGGKAKMFSSAGGTRTDNTSVRSRTRYQLSHPGSPGGSHNPGSSTGGIFSQLGSELVILPNDSQKKNRKKQQQKRIHTWEVTSQWPGQGARR